MEQFCLLISREFQIATVWVSRGERCVIAYAIIRNISRKTGHLQYKHPLRTNTVMLGLNTYKPNLDCQKKYVKIRMSSQMLGGIHDSIRRTGAGNK